MANSARRANEGRAQRPWFRSFHRWLGGIAAFFVLLLALTGIALNHGHAWRMDQRHVTWDWLLSVYGIKAPVPGSSFASGAHRATLMGQRLYLDETFLAGEIPALNGMVSMNEMIVLATGTGILLTTPGAELIEHFDLAEILPGDIQRLGLKAGMPMILSGGQYFEADADVTGFTHNADEAGAGIDWSDETPAPGALLESLSRDYRGRGLSWERLLADLHSGRILGAAGTYFMDFIALSLIVLSMTGLFQWRRRRNGNGRR